MSLCDRCGRTATEIVGMEELCSRDAMITRERNRTSLAEGVDLVVSGPFSALHILTDHEGTPYEIINSITKQTWRVDRDA